MMRDPLLGQYLLHVRYRPPAGRNRVGFMAGVFGDAIFMGCFDLALSSPMMVSIQVRFDFPDRLNTAIPLSVEAPK
jgi:hypothetical protein